MNVLTRNRVTGLLAVALLLVPGVVLAQVAPLVDGGARWAAGGSGVVVEWHPDGRLRRLYAEYAQPVTFPDRRGIRRAQIVAQEKAKAEMVRFLEEHVSQSRTIDQVDREIEAARREFAAQGETLSRSSTREMTDSLREVTRSHAAGTLRGIVVLEQGYNEQREEAWVRVGLSDRTMAAAASARSALDPAGDQIGRDRRTKPAGPAKAGPTRQPTEVTRLQQEDW